MRRSDLLGMFGFRVPNLILYGLGELNSLTAYAAPWTSPSIWTLGLVGTASSLLVIFFKIVPYFQRCRNCDVLGPPMHIPPSRISLGAACA